MTDPVFKVGDRVTWTDVDDGGRSGNVRGVVATVEPDHNRVFVRWDYGEVMWLYPEDLKLVDVVTRLGEVAELSDD